MGARVNVEGSMAEQGKEGLVSGRFWFPEAPGNVVPGRLDLTGMFPRVELLGSLSPFMEERPNTAPGVRMFGPPKPSGSRTLHGALMGPVEAVTIFNARQIRHTANLLTITSPTPNSGLQEETFQGSYAVLGTYATDIDAVFTGIRFRIKSQDQWAHHTGLSATWNQSGGEWKFEYTEPAAISAPLVGLSGNLTLESSATISPPRISGVHIKTTTWLRVETAEGSKIHEAWRRFPVEVSVLLTLLYDAGCPPIAFEIQDPETQRWCEVFMPDLVRDVSNTGSTKRDQDPLINRLDLGLDRLAAWFDTTERFTPLPHIVAGTVQASDRTLPNRLLELAIAAEGVHRKLHPNARRLTDRQVQDALAALSESDMEREARQVLYTAMKLYLWEPSYPQRLAALAADVSVAVPGVTGKTRKWQDAIRDVRVGFAHALAAGAITSDTLHGYATLEESLRWLLTGRLLLELGIPADKLAEKFSAHERYQRFLRNAKRDLPAIYM
jgi:hypothetical protein